MKYRAWLPLALAICSCASGQHDHHQSTPVTASLEPQPIVAQSIRLKEALSFLGSPLSTTDEKALESLRSKPLNDQTVEAIQQILDPYCLATVNINPEARVKVERGKATARL